MSEHVNPDPADREFKAAIRSMWALGDYDRFSRLVWEVGPVLVEAAGAGPGRRVLDVAAGTGNAAIRAAEAGADVVASDLTPEHFVAGQENARKAGVELEWREADAEHLPFDDDEFDVVMSCFGAIFPPRHQKVADQMVRVCKPGGTIAMANFVPDGMLSKFFGVFLPYMPPPREGDLPPILWGDEDHVRELFGGKVSSLELTPRSYVERADTPADYMRFMKETFGPVVAIYAGLDDGKRGELDQAFLEFCERENTGQSDGPAEYVYEYVVLVAEVR